MSDDGKTHSAHSILEELAKQHGADRHDLFRNGDYWHASISWGASDETPIGYTAMLITSVNARAENDLTAVNSLAAKIPAHREKLRAELPEIIKRLRRLAKEI